MGKTSGQWFLRPSVNIGISFAWKTERSTRKELWGFPLDSESEPSRTHWAVVASGGGSRQDREAFITVIVSCYQRDNRHGKCQSIVTPSLTWNIDRPSISINNCETKK